MCWTLELAEGGSLSVPRRIEVAQLGEIVAPADVDDAGLDHQVAQRMLGAIQRAVLVIQEKALQSEAHRQCRLDPTLRLQDYRLRRIQSLQGTLMIRVPRLARRGNGERTPTLLSGSARSTTQYRQLRARLGAWMSFRAASGLIGELFPLASGGCADTMRLSVRDVASGIAARQRPTEAGPVARAESIDLGMDTTFVRSCATDGPRHHEVLIGVATSDDRRILRFGGAIAALRAPPD